MKNFISNILIKMLLLFDHADLKGKYLIKIYERKLKKYIKRKKKSIAD